MCLTSSGAEISGGQAEKAVMFGFLNVRKPKGITSHDVVYKIRKASGIKQVGHTGTLDPFAEGVLPVCVGKATRLIEYLDDDKEYLAVVKFGVETDTYDLDGQVVKSCDKKISKEELAAVIPEFRGEIMQLPKDPVILLSFINMKLRDYYPSLAALCDDLGADEEKLRAALAAAGYEYDEKTNSFR